MLFIQLISIEYTKNERYANFANARRALRFVPVEFDKNDITDEILFNKVDLFQFPEGLKERRNTVKIYGENALFTGTFTNFFGYRIFVKRAEQGYEILYKDEKPRGRIKSKFTLTKGHSGRIVYNKRVSLRFDTSDWFYYLVTFNFVCADKDDFKPKIFFNKNPDFTFTDMKPLQYSGF